MTEDFRMSPNPDLRPASGPGTPPRRVLVVGATGSIGRLVVSAATDRGLRVRALARDIDRATDLLPDVEVVTGDLEDPDSLTAAVQDVDGIVFTHGSGSGAHEQVDYGGVATVLRALGGRRVRIVLMTSINVTRRDAGAYQGLMDWKRRSERLLRASGLPYTIVRPGWFDMTDPGDHRLVLGQGDRGSGAVGRGQLAEVLVRSLLSGAAEGRTFELFAVEGEPPSDWDGLFATAAPDLPGSLDGAADPEDVPLELEAARVRRDVEALRAE
jgi:uncharacterized protein YbjT (DUF2867 family)